MNKYSELSLSSMKKWDLVRYVKQLEEVIEKFDGELNKQHKVLNEATQYIDKCLNTKHKLYLDAVLITIKNILGSDKE